MNKIKVLVVVGLYPPVPGGAGLRAHRTYVRLKRKFNVDFKVISTNNKFQGDEYYIYEGVETIRIQSGRSLLRLIIQVNHVARKYDLASYDLVHVFGESLFTLAVLLWARFHNKKIIKEETLYVAADKMNGILSLKKYLNYFRYYYPLNNIIKKTDLHISLNNNITESLVKRGIERNRIWMRPNPVDEKLFCMPTVNEIINARNTLNIERDDVVHLMVGFINERKNQLFSIDVLNNLPDNHVLIIVGPISDYKYYRDVIDLIQKHQIVNRVKIYPEFKSDIRCFYHAANTLWIPSYNEGTPNVLLEALCSGIPVILNKDLHMHEYVKDDFNGFNSVLMPEEFKNMVLKMVEVAGCMEKRERVSTNAINNYGSKELDKDFYEQILKLNGE